MKKYSFLFLVLALGLLLFSAITMADNYCVQVETYPIAGQSAATIAACGYPHIDEGAKIESLIFANSGATIQTIDVYELSESSLTANIITTLVLPTTGTTQINFPYDTPLTARDVTAIKSATGSTVDATYIYR